MNFEETREFLEGLVGKTVEVSVRVPLAERDEPLAVASFCGIVDRVSQSPASRPSSQLWRVWLGEPAAAPGPVMFVIDEELFEAADVQADVPPADERAESGTTWTVTISQRGFETELLVYV